MKASISLLFVVAPLFLCAQAPDSSTFSLSSGDITEAIVNTSGPARLKVMLTEKKSAELTTFTELNLNKQGRIVVAGKLRSQPFIRERMTGPSIELYVASTDDALATVKALLTSKVKFDQLYKWKDSMGQTHYSETAPVRPAADAPPTGPANDARSKALLKELQGSWVVTNATMNGKQTHDRSLMEAHWKFQGSELVLQSPQKGTGRFAVKFDPKARAFHLAGIEPKDPISGWMLFSRQGDTLRLGFYDNLEGRPAGFEPLEPRAKPELVVVTLIPQK